MAFDERNRMKKPKLKSKLQTRRIILVNPSNVDCSSKPYTAFGNMKFCRLSLPVFDQKQTCAKLKQLQIFGWNSSKICYFLDRWWNIFDDLPQSKRAWIIMFIIVERLIMQILTLNFEFPTLLMDENESTFKNNRPTHLQPLQDSETFSTWNYTCIKSLMQKEHRKLLKIIKKEWNYIFLFFLQSHRHYRNLKHFSSFSVVSLWTNVTWHL